MVYGSLGDGLAQAIAAVMLCIVVVPALLFGTLGWAATRKARPRIRVAAVVVGLLMGPLFGIPINKGVFDLPWSYFNPFASPPALPTFLTLELPADFQRDWFVLVEDPAAEQVIEVVDDGPYTRLRMVAPASGLLRVRSIPRLVTSSYIDVEVPDGYRDRLMMQSPRPLPPGVAGTRWTAAFVGEVWPGDGPDPHHLDDEELARWLNALEETPAPQPVSEPGLADAG